jgi:hypothetical protein
MGWWLHKDMSRGEGLMNDDDVVVVVVVAAAAAAASDILCCVGCLNKSLEKTPV